MKAIPTKYKGRLYRSRLEARWAAFFDFLEWQYEYEPYDLKGWIPDFALYGQEEIVVEVKPFDRFDAYDTKKIKHGIFGTPQCDQPLLLLGNRLRKHPVHHYIYLGWVGWDANAQQHKDGFLTSYMFSTAILTSSEDEEWGFVDGTWMVGDKDFMFEASHDLYIPVPACWEDIDPYWQEAGNLVQWKPPNGRVSHA